MGGDLKVMNPMVESVKKSPKKQIQEYLSSHSLFAPTWMSQEVSKRLVNGLYPQYTPFISRIYLIS